MKNQLSKREYKYRCKIIAENHLKKDYQKYLDEQIKTRNITYKVLYFDPMRLSSILSVVAFRKCSDAIRKMGASAKRVSDAFNNFSCEIYKGGQLMAEYFAGGHLRFIDGQWRRDSGDVVYIREVRRGYWIANEFGRIFICSECSEMRGQKEKYCPNCGTNMEVAE